MAGTDPCKSGSVTPVILSLKGSDVHLWNLRSHPGTKGRGQGLDVILEGYGVPACNVR